MTIPEIKLCPNKTIVNEVQAKIKQVFPLKDYPDGKFGPTTIQNIILADVGGNEIRCSVWGHEDLKGQEGKDVSVKASDGKKGLEGITVKCDTYKGKPTVELTITSKGIFQLVHLGGSQTTVSAPPANAAAPAHTPQAGPRQITRNGQTVGMSLIQANLVLKDHMDPENPKYWDRLHYYASQIMHAAERLEHNDLASRLVDSAFLPKNHQSPDSDVPY